MNKCHTIMTKIIDKCKCSKKYLKKERFIIHYIYKVYIHNLPQIKIQIKLLTHINLYDLNTYALRIMKYLLY